MPNAITSLEQLVSLIQDREEVKVFQALEQQLKDQTELWDKEQQMKDYQQAAVLYQKLDKPNAQRQAQAQASQLAKELAYHPIVLDYRVAQQGVSVLLEHMTTIIEQEVMQGLMNSTK